MRVNLLYPNKDFDYKSQINKEDFQDLINDLGIDVILEHMAKNDDFIYNMCYRVFIAPEIDPSIILYRQDILKDCISNKEVIEKIYQLVLEAIEKRRKSWLGIFSTNVSSLLSSSISLIKIFLEFLSKLRKIADENIQKFNSLGFKNFFEILQKELTEDFFSIAEKQLQALRFNNGIFIKAKLGEGLEGKDYKLLKPNKKVLIKKKILSINIIKPYLYSFNVHPRDDAGINTLTFIKERTIYQIAQILANVGDHILDFFSQLRAELAFYIGTMNLYEELTNLNLPVCFPIPFPQEYRIRSFSDLYDVALALVKKKNIIGNNLNAKDKALFIITGANRGGKTTFLRSIGQSQIMMQTGIFVPASSFSANTNPKIFTHFYRKEDSSLESGKLDEELKRFRKIIDKTEVNSLILLNESFSSTNEKEGSEIAREIIKALIENNIEVFYVTHLYELARYFYENDKEKAIFLRAERREDGKRTFKILEGEPLPTGFAKDIYKLIFSS